MASVSVGKVTAASDGAGLFCPLSITAKGEGDIRIAVYGVDVTRNACFAGNEDAQVSRRRQILAIIDSIDRNMRLCPGWHPFLHYSVNWGGGRKGEWL